MGGDQAPDEVVKGVAQVSLSTDIECLLVGDERRIQAVLEGVSYNPEHIAILHARDAIGMAAACKLGDDRRLPLSNKGAQLINQLAERSQLTARKELEANAGRQELIDQRNH